MTLIHFKDWDFELQIEYDELCMEKDRRTNENIDLLEGTLIGITMLSFLPPENLVDIATYLVGDRWGRYEFDLVMIMEDIVPKLPFRITPLQGELIRSIAEEAYEVPIIPKLVELLEEIDNIALSDH
jgi:hypothetical protein